MYHYIVGVRAPEAFSDEPPSIDGFIEYTDEDMDDCKMEVLMDRCLDEGEKEPTLTKKSDQYTHAIYCMSVRARFNPIMHVKYAAKFQITEEQMSDYIKNTPIKELKKAKIRL